MGDKLSRQGQEFVRSRAAAGLLLLALTAHAFIASATHFHRLTNLGVQSTHAAFQNREERGQNVPLTGDDKQCLLCRLQRNFVTDVQQATIIVAPPPVWTLGYDLLQDVPARAPCTLLRTGRAPPSTQA